MKKPPPRLSRWLLHNLLPASIREFVLGDLDEEFHTRLGQSYRRRVWWYRSQALRSCWHCLRHRRLFHSPIEHQPRRWEDSMQFLVKDLMYTLRSLRKAPTFSILVVATLAIGVGSITAIFSAVNDGLLRPLPVLQPDRLVMLFVDNQERGWDGIHAAPANIMDWRERVSAFEDVAHYSDFTSTAALVAQGEPHLVTVGQVSGNLFSVLGAQPLLGRTFFMEETWDGHEPVALLRHEAWQRLFNGNPEIVGKTVRIDEISHQIVGVMGEGFGPTLTQADLWVPYGWTAERRASTWFRQAHVARAIARLQVGVSLEQARTELSAVASALQKEHPELNRGMEAGLQDLQQFLFGSKRLPLLFLLGAVIVLQLMACANVANLLLARGVERRGEFAVRAAMGAGRSRLMKQTLTESLTLAVLGSLAGVGLAAVGLRTLASLSPGDLTVRSLSYDWRVTLFVFVTMSVSALVFGLLPAWTSARGSVAGQLVSRTRSGTANRQHIRVTHGLTAVQVALAVMLLAGAGLLVRSLHSLQAVESGVNSDNVLTFEITPPSGTYPTASSRRAFGLAVADSLRTLSGVVDAGVVSGLPFMGGGWTSDFKIEGSAPDDFGMDVRHRAASPEYFAAMEIPVHSGRLFPARLGPNEAVPVVVNQAFADRYFPDGSPVGRRIAFDRIPDENTYWYPIAAVVGNERLSANQETPPEIVSHLAGDTPRTLRFAVRTAGPPLNHVLEVRSAIEVLDPGVPMAAVRTMNGVASQALASQRFLMILLMIFAGSALALAGVGIYGVAAQMARMRRREMGIRIALGAQRSSVISLLLMRGGVVTGVGLLLGLGGAVAAGRMIEGLLFEVRATDPVALAVASFILAFISLLACYLPARRATQIAPAQVLTE